MQLPTTVKLVELHAHREKADELQWHILESRKTKILNNVALHVIGSERVQHRKDTKTTTAKERPNTNAGTHTATGATWYSYNWHVE